jgi:hypothetical protein
VHLKSWLVEVSAHGENWREVAREDDNKRLNGYYFTGTFAESRECRFIRLVNIGRNHNRDGQVSTSAWDMLGSLVE